MNEIKLTEASNKLLVAIHENAGNWSGTPPTYDHIFTPADKGNLTDLKKKGLISTFESNGEEWIEILPAGVDIVTGTTEGQRLSMSQEIAGGMPV